METRVLFVPVCVAIIAAALIVFVLNFPKPAVQVESRVDEILTGVDSESNDGRPGQRVPGRLAAQYRPAEHDSRLMWLERQLEKKTAECNALRRRLDESEALLDRLLSESESLRPPLSTRLSNRKPDHATAAAAASGASGAPQESQSGTETIESLRRDLQQTREELADLEAEFRVAVEDGRELLAAASEVVVASGQTAVPTLTALLGDEDPGVRAWAAYVLGEIGPQASSAAAALREALSDPDEGVRMEAELALERIESNNGQ